jgi:hypothetical protein
MESQHLPKAYVTPALVVLGDLRRLTAGGGGTKNEPGGPMTPNTKA